LPVLKSPPKRVKNATIQVRVEESVKSRLDSYSQFIGANQAYVVSEALNMLFKKDGEFRHWLAQRVDGQSCIDPKGDNGTTKA